MGSNGRGRRNVMRELMDTRALVVGAFLNLTDPAVVDIAALAGYDFVVAEAEHGSLTLAMIGHYVRAAHNRDLGILVRVPAGDPGYIQRVLDVGVDGVQVPHVQSVTDARRAVAAVRYPPEGARGMFPKGVVSEFGAHGYANVAELVSALNAQTICNVIIEDAAGVENIDEILAVPGLDIVTIGPGDLSGSMGLIDRPQDPAIHAAIDKVLEACQRAHIPAHLPVSHAPHSPEELEAKGVWMLSSGTDLGTLLAGMRADLAAAPTAS
jgi:2-keto-3-deoxy-L-rhamnonate aldolase RhmA